MEGWVGLSTMSVNNLVQVIYTHGAQAILGQGYYSKAVLVGLEPATSESLVRDLTTTPPSHQAV